MAFEKDAIRMQGAVAAPRDKVTGKNIEPASQNVKLTAIPLASQNVKMEAAGAKSLAQDQSVAKATQPPAPAGAPKKLTPIALKK